MKVKAGIVIAILLSLPLQSLAKAEGDKPAAEKRKPIVVKFKTMQGLQYFHAGKKLEKLADFQDIVTPVKDGECDRLLKESGSDETTGVVLLVAGGAVLVGGVVVGVSDPYRGDTLDGQQTVGLIIGLAGLVGDYVGIFKIVDAQTAKFAAVQRYNAIIHGDDLNELTLQKRGVQMDLLAFRF